MKEQHTPIPTGPVELDLFADELLNAPASEHGAPTAASPAAADVADGPADSDDADGGSAVETTAGAVASGKPKKESKTAGSASDTKVPRKKKKKKKKKHHEEAPKQKTFVDQIHDFINEDEDQPININFHGLIGGNGLPGFFKKNWVFVSVIVFFTCCYVSCRYMMQSAVLEHDKLTDILVDRRYKNLTIDCDLLEHTLGSHIERHLKDSTIHTPTEQSFTLPAAE